MENILAVVTLFVGFITASLLDSWRDKRTITREREARIEEFKIKLTLRRTDFLRQNLIELQDQLSDLGRMTSKCKHFFDSSNSSKEYGKIILPDDINDGFLAANKESAKLIVRIHDENLRALVKKFKKHCNSVALADSHIESDLHTGYLVETLHKINDRVGFLYKDLDSVEDSLFNQTG